MVLRLCHPLEFPALCTLLPEYISRRCIVLPVVESLDLVLEQVEVLLEAAEVGQRVGWPGE